MLVRYTRVGERVYVFVNDMSSVTRSYMESFVNDIYENVRKVSLTPAKCALDLSDGSERADYVNQDYILNGLGRPHRNINIMFTYYPLDKEWPARASEVNTDPNVRDAWGYCYDDYPTYGGGIGGSKDADVFEQMRDIRRHGQDVTLTLTIDCAVGDEHLIAIAKDLSTFGRIRLRINHECTGTWFQHNRRYTVKQIGEFFVRFDKIIKQYAPNVKTILCAGFVNKDGELEYEDDLIEAYKAADIWSGDRYMALHFGWPFDVCEKEVPSFTCSPVKTFYDFVGRTADYLKQVTGQDKPFVASELNIDGDVTGPARQGDGIKILADMLKEQDERKLTSFTMYQFRDEGRLGLEVSDPNNKAIGIRQPLYDVYKKILHDDYFKPGLELGKELALTKTNSFKNQVKLRWGGAEDAEGIALRLKLEKTPVFMDMSFEEDLSLMICVNDRWFYKAPQTKVIDLMPAFFEAGQPEVKPGEELDILVFATPPTGENEPGRIDYETTIKKLPKLHLRYEPVARLTKYKTYK